jgi:hypothetical protein
MTLASSISLELHLLMMLESSFTIIMCLNYRPQFLDGRIQIWYIMIPDSDGMIPKELLQIVPSPTDNSRGVIYDCNIFIINAKSIVKS